MRDMVNLGIKLLVIALVAGLALGVTNAVTKGPIASEQVAAAETARKTVLPDAAAFEATACDGVEEAYVGTDAAGKVVGATGTLTVTGFGGPIEITAGVNGEGVITGVSVGGSSFAETAGLGAKTKDAAFTSQFIGKDASVSLRRGGGGETDATSSATSSGGAGSIDAVTSATISSTAVTNGVSAIVTAIAPLAKEGK